MLTEGAMARLPWWSLWRRGRDRQPWLADPGAGRHLGTPRVRRRPSPARPSAGAPPTP